MTEKGEWSAGKKLPNGSLGVFKRKLLLFREHRM
jgi:hypothetical protein